MMTARLVEEVAVTRRRGHSAAAEMIVEMGDTAERSASGGFKFREKIEKAPKKCYQCYQRGERS